MPKKTKVKNNRFEKTSNISVGSVKKNKNKNTNINKNKIVINIGRKGKRAQPSVKQPQKQQTQNPIFFPMPMPQPQIQQAPNTDIFKSLISHMKTNEDKIKELYEDKVKLLSQNYNAQPIAPNVSQQMAQVAPDPNIYNSVMARIKKEKQQLDLSDPNDVFASPANTPPISPKNPILQPKPRRHVLPVILPPETPEPYITPVSIPSPDLFSPATPFNISLPNSPLVSPDDLTLSPETFLTDKIDLINIDTKIKEMPVSESEIHAERIAKNQNDVIPLGITNSVIFNNSKGMNQDEGEREAKESSARENEPIIENDLSEEAIEGMTRKELLNYIKRYNESHPDLKYSKFHNLNKEELAIMIYTKDIVEKRQKRK